MWVRAFYITRFSRILGDSQYPTSKLEKNDIIFFHFVHLYTYGIRNNTPGKHKKKRKKVGPSPIASQPIRPDHIRPNPIGSDRTRTKTVQQVHDEPYVTMKTQEFGRNEERRGSSSSSSITTSNAATHRMIRVKYPRTLMSWTVGAEVTAKKNPGKNIRIRQGVAGGKIWPFGIGDAVSVAQAPQNATTYRTCFVRCREEIPQKIHRIQLGRVTEGSTGGWGWRVEVLTSASALRTVMAVRRRGEGEECDQDLEYSGIGGTRSWLREDSVACRGKFGGGVPVRSGNISAPGVGGKEGREDGRKKEANFGTLRGISGTLRGDLARTRGWQEGRKGRIGAIAG